MKKIATRGMAVVLSMIMFLSMITVVEAEETEEILSGEQTISQEEDESGVISSGEITIMDEEGNITVIEDKSGIVETSEANTARATTTKVVNFKTKTSGYTTSYTEYGTGAAGYTNGSYGADAAYLGTENGKIKFMLAGVVGLVNSSEVQIVNLSDTKSVSCYVVQNGRLWHRISMNLTDTSYSALDQGPAPSYLTSGVTYYSYDGHYFYKDYATMLDDYCYGDRESSLNPKNPYYNYYQFLPMRSKTSYSTTALGTLINAKLSSGSVLKDTASIFVNYQNTYGVNALLMAGIAANESAWGVSNIAKTKNNLFGLNAVDSAPGDSSNAYSSVDECIRQFAETYMSKRYLYPNYSYYHGAYLGNKASGINVSYASDPYWGEKAANAAWTLDKNGGSVDYGKYTIGIKDSIATSHTSVNVRNASNTSSTVLYKTGKWAEYAVLLKSTTKENGFYKIQSDAVLNSERTAVNSSSGKYDIDKMYAYISADYVTVIKQADNSSSNNGSSNSDSSAATYTKYKTTTSVNYRTGPGTSYSKAGTLATGTTIEVEDGYSKSANGYTWYRFKLNSKTYYVASSYLTKVATTTTLSKPTLVSATYSGSTVTVTWKKVTNAKGYYVYRKLSGGSWSKIGTVSSGSTVTYKDSSSLTEGKTYLYTVKAYAGSTVSGYNSSGVSVTIPTKTYTPYKTTTSVNYRSGAGTSYSKGGTLASGKIIEIEDGYSKTANGYTWYRFKLNSKTYYIASKYVTKLTLSKPTLSSVSYSSNAVTFKWKKVTNAKGYYVYRKVKGGSYKKIKTITSGSTVLYKDTSSLTAGTTYVYTVRAYYGSVKSGYKTGLSIKIPGVSYTKYVTTTGVNYRTGPGTSYSKGGTLAAGKTIQVENGYSKTANGYTWYRFKLNSKNYYIASKYLKKS